jgi:pimeloyl-ACP methyl ester carboxylesterase
MRLWFAVESRVAPTSAERRAARMFVTPPKHKRSSKASLRLIHSKEPEATHITLHEPGVRVSATSIGDGPTVMLLHGWGGSAVDMMPTASALARAGYRSVVFDMPGHGRSPGRESSLVEFLRAMSAVSRTLGAPDFIVGHSFGGAAAVLGITELGLPVRGAVLFSPAPGPAYYVDRFARTVGLPRERTVGMMRLVVERVGRSVESLDALVAARSARVPALIFHDPADREVPFSFAQQMSTTWAGSRLVERPSLGHKRILRDASTIAAAVDFTRSVLPPAPR